MRGQMVTNLYAWTLGGHQNFLSDRAKAVENAKYVVEQFDIVGYTNNMPGFESKVSALIERPVTIGKNNTTISAFQDNKEVYEIYREIFTDDVRAIVAEKCRDDYQIYDHAVKLHPIA